MFTLDVKDTKILYHLDLDSRQSYKELGKKVGLSKNVVNYRVNRLLQRNIITTFYTQINTNKLGYSQLALYIKYQYYTPLIEKNIINIIKTQDNCWWIANIQGHYDLECRFLIKDNIDFYFFMQHLLNTYRYHIKTLTFSYITNTTNYPKTYLTTNIPNHLQWKHTLPQPNTSYPLDPKSHYILKTLSKNSRTPLTEIANTLHNSSTMVKQKIDTLKKDNIITAYRLQINPQKLGYQHYTVHYNLKDYHNRQHIINTLQQHKELLSLHEVIGHCDLIANFHSPNFHKVHNIIKTTYNAHPDTIKNHMTFSYPTLYKIDPLPL